MKLILASSSPRRRELLGVFGIEFEIDSADIDESPRTNETPAAMTERLARQKAEHIFSARGQIGWVLGGDTTVAVGDMMLGKPAEHNEAVAMLERLSGREHRVISAVALVGPGFSQGAISVTTVLFDTLSTEQIARYCDSDEPYDKAGGYGIQGLAGTFVRELRGSYSGVVGLPLYETRQLLEQAGLM